MTRTFTTPRFRTAFDPVIEPLTLPGELHSGAAPELTTVDHMVRGNAVIGRFSASPALFGVKVRPTGRPVRVTAHFRFDSMSLDWWEQRVMTDAPIRGAGAPRLVLVRSQGKTRGAALLVRPAVDFHRAATGLVCFDLQPEELTAEGLFVFEMVSIDTGRPAWAPAVPAGSVGVMMDVIEFAEVDGDRHIGLVSTGTLPPDSASGPLSVSAGYFVANPSDRDEPRRWIARATLVDPVLPGPRTKFAPFVDPVGEPGRPSTSRSAKQRLKYRAKRAARWVVPVAAVPVARKARTKAAGFERRLVRAARRRISVRSVYRLGSSFPARRVWARNPLADVMFDLVSRDLVEVELAGVEGGAMPGVQVRAREGAEIEIVTDAPLTVPALVRLSIDPSSLRGVPGVDDKTVSWELVETGL